MEPMGARPSVLLIFGTSHVGKSTLAGRLGVELGWRTISTDGLGRHPGRPWPEVRPPVAEFYASLTDETVYWFLRAHHENMWPIIEETIRAVRGPGEGLVLEGSALRPELIADLDREKVLAVGLHADPAFLRDRMMSQSGYARRDDHGRLLIDRFITRSLRDNDQIVHDANRLGLRLLDAADAGALERLAEELVGVLADGHGRDERGDR